MEQNSPGKNDPPPLFPHRLQNPKLLPRPDLIPLLSIKQKHGAVEPYEGYESRDGGDGVAVAEEYELDWPGSVGVESLTKL